MPAVKSKLKDNAVSREAVADLSLRDFVPVASNYLTTPYHLDPMGDWLSSARGGKLRTCIAAPVQHGKTTYILHWIAWTLLNRPDTHIIYATYGQKFSESNSRKARDIYLACGGAIRDGYNTIQEWVVENPDGQDGKLLATSVDGQATGHKAHVVIIDDPCKGELEACDPEYVEKVMTWIVSTVSVRLPPGGSIGLVASRFSDEDPSGRLIGEKGWDEIRIPAINDADADGNLTDPRRPIGAALCPDGPDPAEPRDLAFLESKKLELLGMFDAMFQGKPGKRTGAIFKGPHQYRPEDIAGLKLRLVKGYDIAYSGSGDWIVGVAGGEAPDGRIYILDAIRLRQSLESALPQLVAWDRKWPSEIRGSYVSGPELGCIQLAAMAHIAEDGSIIPGLYISGMPARWSKLVRAQQTARDWNGGKILLPPIDSLPWVRPFASIVGRFTGRAGERDDDTDALVSMRDILVMSKGVVSKGGILFPTRCMN